MTHVRALALSSPISSASTRATAAVAAILLALSLLAAVLSPAAAQQTGTVTANSLNVRSGPGTNFRVVGVLRRGEQVTILERSGGWLRVAAGRDRGWVAGNYISTYYANQRPYSHRGRDIDIISSRFGSANVFAGPGRTYDLVAKLDNGVSVRVIERGREWTLIAKEGVGRGYVRSGFLVD